MSAPGGEHTLAYRPDIDGLRAVAILLVLVFHFDLFDAGDAGFVGVDLFFVISGYLISTILWRDLERGHFTFGRFYAKRIRRLAPALIVVQLAALVCAALWLLPSEVLSLVRESVFAQTYLSNVYYWRTLDYFGLQANGAFLLHTWSLAVEEQFYLVYPLLLVAVHRWAPRRLHFVLACVVATSFALNLALLGPKPEATFYLLPTRAWELGLGALIPWAEPFVAARRGAREAAGVGAVALLGAALVLYGPGTAFPGWFALLPTGAGVLAILAGTGAGSAASRLIATPPAVWVGRISYPLYLVHWPIHIFALTLLAAYGPAARWGMFVLSILGGWLIHRLIERPVQAGRWFARDGRVVAGYAAGLVLVLVVIGSGWASGGWRFRFTPQVLAIADTASDDDPLVRGLGSLPPGHFAERIRPIGAPGVEPRWMVYGDSHAGALAHAFSLWLAGRHEAGVIAYQNGCMPLVDTGDAACRRFNRDTLEFVRVHPGIGNVALVSIWRQPLGKEFTDRSGRVVGRSEAMIAFEGDLRTTLQALHDLRAKVFVWQPMPAMPSAVPQTMARNAIFGTTRAIDTPYDLHARTFAFLEQALDRNAALIAGRIHPERDLCRAGRCSGAHDGRPLFFDSSHPAVHESAVFARILERQMQAVPPATAQPAR